MLVLSNSAVRFLNALGVAGITLVLLIGFGLQLGLNELPCPLCLLQRVAFCLVLFGFMLNVLKGVQYAHYGLVILGAIFGASVALRQVCLHIVPGTGTYGSPIFGLHFYTWSFLLFSATIFAVAILLLFSQQRPAGEALQVSKLEKGICWTAVGVTVANAIAALLECGPGKCPDNPVNYKLLSLLSVFSG